MLVNDRAASGFKQLNPALNKAGLCLYLHVWFGPLTSVTYQSGGLILPEDRTGERVELISGYFTINEIKRTKFELPTTVSDENKISAYHRENSGGAHTVQS